MRLHTQQHCTAAAAAAKEGSTADVWLAGVLATTYTAM
jgi:hypothetical protein